MKRRLLAIIGALVLMVSLAPAVVAQDFGDEGSFNSGDACGGAREVSIEALPVLHEGEHAGWRILPVSGPHHQGFHRVDAQGNSVLAELDTILPAGMYLVAPDVRGTGWTYSVDCDPTQQVLDHIERRVNDPTVNTQGMLVLPDEFPQVLELFVPVGEAPASGPNFGSTDDGGFTPPTNDTATNPDSGVYLVDPEVDEDSFADPVIEPATYDGSAADPNLFAGEGDENPADVELSSSAQSLDAAEILADADNDRRNPFDNQGACMPLGPRSYGLDTEASTSGAYLMIGFFNEDEGRNQVTVLPNGSFALGGRLYTEDEATDILGNSQNQPLDVHCSFNEMLVEVDKFLAEYGLDHTALIGFRKTGMFTRKDRVSQYYGVGNRNGNLRACRMLAEGLFQKRKVVGDNINFWQIDGWQPSGAAQIGNAELSTVIDPGMKFQRRSGIKGWVRIYDGSTCRRGQVLAEMRGNSNRRIERGENVVGWVNNWDASRFEIHPDVGGGTAPNPFPSWMTPVR